MNYKESMEGDHIPEFINLEEYNNLLRELDALELDQLTLSEFTIKIQLPEVITESIKLITNVFYRIPMDRYLQHCVFSSLITDFDRILGHHESYKRLSELLKKLDNDV